MKKQIIMISIIGFLMTISFVVPQQAFAVEKLFYFFNNTYGFDNFKKNVSGVDIIAPQIYTVGYDLKIKKPSNTKIIKEAKKRQVDSMPLLVNADFSKILMSDILLSETAQDEIINFMVTEAQKNKYIGWQFDFENLNHLDRDMYSAFVAKTYKVMQKNNLKFSVAVIPRNKPYDANSTNQDWSSGYDFKKIAENTDFVSLMSYDDPYSVGPVASIPFTKKILDYMMTQIPSEKISLGIPLYCWKWDNQINMKVGSTTHKLALKEYSKGKNKSKGYDKNLGAQWFKYSKNNTEYTIWCESEQSIDAKLKIIEDNNLRGFSAWAIGQEATWFWKTIKNR